MLSFPLFSSLLQWNLRQKNSQMLRFDELVQSRSAAGGDGDPPSQLVVCYIEPVEIGELAEAGRYVPSEVVGVQRSEKGGAQRLVKTCVSEV